jgi:uncharacterized protein YjbI with pentapeptide repeats
MVRLRWPPAEPPKSPARSWQYKAAQAWASFKRELYGIRKDPSYTPAFVMLGVCVAGLLAWKAFGTHEWGELWPELGGMVFDIIFVVLVFGFFERRNRRRSDIARQHEVIADFKRWDSQEARLNIAGAIRRLNQQDVFAVDLGGARISDFEFAAVGIRSIAGSTFYDGSWGDPHHRTEVSLTRVKFDHLDCSTVCFSPFDPMEALAGFQMRWATFEDCSFVKSDLTGATFNGAALEWTAPPPASLFVEEEYDDGIHRIPFAYGPFDNTSLKGVSFRGARFKNADFRGAEDVAKADFYRASGLDEALFDTDEIKALALASANRE